MIGYQEWWQPWVQTFILRWPFCAAFMMWTIICVSASSWLQSMNAKFDGNELTPWPTVMWISFSNWWFINTAERYKNNSSLFREPRRNYSHCFRSLAFSLTFLRTPVPLLILVDHFILWSQYWSHTTSILYISQLMFQETEENVISILIFLAIIRW